MVLRSAAAFCIAPLLLSGCIKELFQGETNVLRPEIIKVKGHTDNPKPPAKELCPVPEGPAGKQETPQQTGKPCPPVEQNLLPQQLSPQSPEQLMPVLPPSPKLPEKPQSSIPVPPRPLAAAAAPAVSCGDSVLTEDVTWRGEVLVSGVVTVAPQATLTIGPGAVVRFAGPEGLLLVEGRVAASGTPEKPILFTSRFAEPAGGDWRGIVLLGSEKKNLLENCRVEGAETGLDASFSRVTLNNVSFARCTTGARLQDTVVAGNGGGASGCGVGMSLVDSDAELRDAVFSGNRWGVVAERGSLSLAGGAMTGNGSAGVKGANSRVKISGGRFAANGTGLTLTACQGTVSGCSIAGNGECGLVLAGSRVKVHGNEIAKNGTFGLKVEDGTGAAWGNSFAANGGYDLYNAGAEDFRAMGNWWGGTPAAEVGKRIYDRDADSGRGRVFYLPVLKERPATIP